MNFPTRKDFDCWTHYNVAKWIYKDGNLYNMTKKFMKNNTRSLSQSAYYMFEKLKSSGELTTPEGVKFSVTSIMETMLYILNNDD